MEAHLSQHKSSVVIRLFAQLRLPGVCVQIGLKSPLLDQRPNVFQLIEAQIHGRRLFYPQTVLCFQRRNWNVFVQRNKLEEIVS